MEEKFKKTEYTLYNYKGLEVKINNIKIDIENIENDITVRAVGYEERTQATNDFHSSVENEVIHIDEKVKILKAKLKYNQDLKKKIDNALEQLPDIELKLVKLRYFSKDKPSWECIGMDLGFSKDYCMQLRNKIINKLSDMIYF